MMPALRVLLKKTHTIVIFNTAKEQAYLFLAEEHLQAKKNNKGTHTVAINGSKASICEVLNGTVSIRQLQALNQLHIQGNYRQVLLVEAILLLSRNQVASV